MTTTTFDTLSTVALAVVREVAMHMNVLLNDPQADVIAETVAYAIDERHAAHLITAPQRSPEIITAASEIAARHVRAFYFLQVGTSIGLELGYTREADMDELLRLANIYDVAFDQTLTDRRTEIIWLPPVWDYVRAALTKGVEFCRASRDDEGYVTEEWLLALYDDTYDFTHHFQHRPSEEGPAVTKTSLSGIIVYEEYAEYGMAHRVGAPAIIERNDSGAVVCARYFDMGEERAGPSRRADA